MNDLLKKLQETDRTLELYPKNEKTLVGFSGGADSMTLLHALSVYLGKENIIAVHVNHLLRGADADADEAFCECYCRENGIRFFSRRVDVNALCGGKSFEETARNVRYQIFAEIAQETGCATVSLAHTADDNLETVIFHLCRGAGAAGTSGIPPKRPMDKLFIVRPLIDCTRSDILAYIEENGLSYQTDATNENTAYTRNFIRKNIIPLLREINPAAAENVRNTCTTIAALSAHIEAEADVLLPKESATQLPLTLLREKDEALLYAMLNRLYQNAGGTALPSTQAKALTAHIRKGHRGVCLSLPCGITAELRGDYLRFFKGEEKHESLTEEIPLHRGENHVTDHIFVYVDTACPNHPFAFRKSTRIPASSLSFLTLRPRKNGESYRFGGMTRSLKKLLSGAEIEKKHRPLLCDRYGILWHPDFSVRDNDTGEKTIEIHYIEII